MAKSKNNDEDITFLGRNVDPDIQKKVDQYMEIGDGDSPGDDPIETFDQPVNDDDPMSTAPLLPTDELPANVKTSSTKINVSHENDPVEEVDTVIDPEEGLQIDPDEEVNNQAPPDIDPVEKTPDEDSAEIVTEDPEADIRQEAEDAEDLVVDSEIIDLDSDLDALSDSTSEIDLDTSKTVGELVDTESANNLDDQNLEAVIEDIVAEDADKVLEIEDRDRAKSEIVSPKSNSVKSDNFFNVWFTTPLYRNLTIIFVLIIILVTMIISSSRYFVLNTMGLRVSASIKALDDKTSLPLKNVEFILGGQSVKTDKDGNAKIENVKLGKQEFIVKKVAFAEIKKTVDIGWRANNLGDQKLVATGIQFKFSAKDFVSDKPVKDAEVSYGDSSTAKFDDKGVAILTISATDQPEIEVNVLAPNYRDEKIKISTSSKETVELQMVTSKKHIFVSKRNGRFDLYKGDYDGKNEEVILAASGIEKEESLALAPHPSKPLVAFSSTRENTRNQDGFLLSTLYIINTETKEVNKLTQSERIQLVNWSGNRLVYVKITQGASEANLNRHKLISYDTDSSKEKELASTNYFNDVVAVGNVVYYSPALYRVNGKVGLYRIDADGSNQKTIYDKEVWNIFRTSYDKFSVSVGQDWYEVDLKSNDVKKIGGAPSVLRSRVYVDSPSKQQSIWVDERDGKSVLLSYGVNDKKEQALLTESGVKNPIYWLDDDHIVYRIADNTETADYIISLSGGSPKKVGDVTNTAGVDRWYYF